MERAYQFYAQQQWEEAYQAFDALEGARARYYAGLCRAQLVGRPEHLPLVAPARQLLEQAHAAGVSEAAAALAQLHWTSNEWEGCQRWAVEAGDFLLLCRLHHRRGDLAALEQTLGDCHDGSALAEWGRQLCAEFQLPAARLVWRRAAELGEAVDWFQELEIVLALAAERERLPVALVMPGRLLDSEGRRRLNLLAGRAVEAEQTLSLDEAGRRALMQSCPTFCRLRPDLLQVVPVGPDLPREFFASPPSSIGRVLSADCTRGRGGGAWGAVVIVMISSALALYLPAVRPLALFWGGALAWGYWQIRRSLDHEVSFLGEHGLYLATRWAGRVRGRLLRFAEAARVERVGQTWLWWRDSRGYRQGARPLFRLVANPVLGKAAEEAFRTFKVGRQW